MEVFLPRAPFWVVFGGLTKYNYVGEFGLGEERMMTREKALEALAVNVAAFLHNDTTHTIHVGKGAFEIKDWAGGNCRGVDIGEYRFVTQNPTKNSKWAAVAQRGGQVTWMIHRETNTWVTRVHNGNYEQLREFPCVAQARRK